MTSVAQAGLVLTSPTVATARAMYDQAVTNANGDRMDLGHVSLARREAKDRAFAALVAAVLSDPAVTR